MENGKLQVQIRMANLIGSGLRPREMPKTSGDEAFYLRKKKASCGHCLTTTSFLLKRTLYLASVRLIR